MSAETFARLTVTDTADGTEEKIEFQSGALADMRHRFAQWRQELLAAGTS